MAKPINILGLNSWVGHIPMSLLKNIKNYAPMLETLGYDLSPDPYYGEPDEVVRENLRMLELQPEKFKIETYRWENGRKVKGAQFGAEQMQKRQYERMSKDASDDIIEMLQNYQPPN